MTAPLLADAFTLWDFAAVLWLLGLWLAFRLLMWRGERTGGSTGEIMAGYRYRWLEAAADRDQRIIDATILNGLRQGVAFFISATLIGLGGAIALIGQTDQVAGVAKDLAGGLSAPRESWIVEAPRVAWIVKLLLVIAMLGVAFLHFVWAHRVLGYVAVMIGAIPNERGDEARRVARKAARINVLATRHFNRGLAAVYFTLAALAWLIGPGALALAAAYCFATLVRREFFSETRRALLDD